ncbi:hypothetical protein [Peribacillus muralis]|uniref:hypothetical protein n=1 Tax=Peribacillus muralis TaxID=264697 RepID=UPI003D02FDB9
MLKKLCVVGTIFAGLTMGNSALAAEIETETTITNISVLSEVSSVTPGIATATAGKTIKVTSKVNAKNPLVGAPNATATSSASASEDSISAKEDKQSYSKYAGATYTSKSGSIPSKAFGNHNYIKKSYKTIRHETVDTY